MSRSETRSLIADWISLTFEEVVMPDRRRVASPNLHPTALLLLYFTLLKVFALGKVALLLFRIVSIPDRILVRMRLSFAKRTLLSRELMKLVTALSVFLLTQEFSLGYSFNRLKAPSVGEK